jgi:hypothetical protein
MENKSLKLTMTNDAGVTMNLTLELSFGEQQGLLVNYRVTDADGATVDTMEPDGDVFGFFSLVNQRVGDIMKSAETVWLPRCVTSTTGGI